MKVQKGFKRWETVEKFRGKYFRIKTVPTCQTFLFALYLNMDRDVGDTKFTGSASFNYFLPTQISKICLCLKLVKDLKS